MRELITCGHIRIADLAMHKNRGMELTYITKGRMEWVVDGRVEVVQQGDVFFTLPWQLHGSPVLQQPENEAWHLLFRLPGDYRRPRASFRFPRSLGLPAAQERRLSRHFSRSTRHAWPATQRMRQIFHCMISRWTRRRCPGAR
ncbi:MAG: cupin domain-containing protein [Verrucomicrobiota bacterium]